MAGLSFTPKTGIRKIQEVLWYPHLPVREEHEPCSIGVPRKLIKSYTDKDLRQIGHSVRDRLECKLQNSRTVQNESSCRRTRRERREGDMRILETEYDPDLDKKAEWSLKRLKKAMRGKSADVISTLLLKDGMEQQSMQQHFQQESAFSAQEVLRSRVSRRQVHVSMMDERDTKRMEESITEPLDGLRGQIQVFGKKENIYLSNKRWSIIN